MICAPRGMFDRDVVTGAGTVEKDGRSAEEFTAELEDAAARAAALAAALRSRTARAVPADLLAGRLRLPGDLPQPMTVTPRLRRGPPVDR